jgi:hypothetical protein
LPARDSERGRKPRSRGLSGRPAASCGVRTDWRNGKWVRQAQKRVSTPAEEKASKGESHERCRHETRSARFRREEIAKRVTKP